MYDRIWQVFCDRLESEVRSMDNRDYRMCNDDSSEETIRTSEPNIEAYQGVRIEGVMYGTAQGVGVV